MTFEVPNREATSTLASAVEVTFDVPWSEQTDTARSDPIEIFLEVMYTATEVDPD